MNPALPGIAAIFFYSLGSYSQVRTFVSRTVTRESDLARFTLPALLFHAIFVYSILGTSSGIDLSFFNVAALISLAITAAIILASIRQPVHMSLIHI